MFPRFCLLLLGLFIGCQAEICTFKHHLCKWDHLYDKCHFRHEMKKDLQGESGYLYLSKNTCKRAGIYFYTTSSYHRFQLHYFINGTGYGTIAAYGNYRWTGRYLLWSCNLNYGPQWNKADIFAADGTFAALRYITIEAVIKGDMTVAIGNIARGYTGNPVDKCPRPQPTTIKPTTMKTTTIKTTTKKPTTIKTTTRKPTTIKSITRKATTHPKPIQKTTSDRPTKTDKDKQISHSIKLTTKNSKSPKVTLAKGTTIKHVSKQFVTSTPYKPARTSSDKIRTSKSNLNISYTTKPIWKTSKRNEPQPIPTSTQSDLKTTTVPEEFTPIQDISTSKTEPDQHNSSNFEPLQQQQVSKKRKIAAVAGGSVFGIVSLITVAVISFLVYKRKIRIYKFQASNKDARGFSNPVYQ